MDLKKYLNSGSKKRELNSETSTSGNYHKKVRDGILDNSDSPDDIFTEGLSSKQAGGCFCNTRKVRSKQAGGCFLVY